MTTRLTSVLFICSFSIGLFISSGCSRATWQRVAQGAAQGMAQGSAQSAQAQPSINSSFVKLMIFGGEGHSTYLGCLNCSEYDSDSVFNKFSTYGSSSNAQSIWNHYGEYGSSYSSFSACNSYASDPPVVVDGNGKYYGRLTTNSMRTDGPTNQNIRAWLSAICQN